MINLRRTIVVAAIVAGTALSISTYNQNNLQKDELMNKLTVITLAASVLGTSAFAANDITVESYDLGTFETETAAIEAEVAFIAEFTGNIPAFIPAETQAEAFPPSIFTIIEDDKDSVVVVDDFNINPDADNVVSWSGTTPTVLEDDDYNITYDLTNVQPVIDNWAYGGPLSETPSGGFIGQRILDVREDVEALRQQVTAFDIQLENNLPSAQSLSSIDAEATRITDEISSINADINAIRALYDTVNALGN